MKSPRSIHSLLVLLVATVLALLESSHAFVPTTTGMQSRQHVTNQYQRLSTAQFLAVDPMVSTLSVTSASSSSATTTATAAFTSIPLSAVTLDPTTVLSDILGGLLGSPAILLVPILAALGVASLIAFFIVSYANPVVEDDE